MRSWVADPYNSDSDPNSASIQFKSLVCILFYGPLTRWIRTKTKLVREAGLQICTIRIRIQIQLQSNSIQDYGFNLWKPEVYLPAMKRDFADYENMFTFHTNTSGGGTGWPNAGGRTLLLREMLESDVFRERFILRCADLLNHLWSGDRVVGRIDAMAAVIRGEIPRHLERWSWAAVQERGFGLPHKEEDEPLNLEHWERNVEVMRTFGSGRPEQLRGQLMDHFGFGNGTAEVAVTIQNADKGSVVINTLTVPSEAWSGTYFKDVPISIRAVPNEGATFTGWSGDVSGSELEMMLSLSTADVTIQAVFE